MDELQALRAEVVRLTAERDAAILPWRVAFENAARMAEHGVLSMDGGQAASEIRSLAPDRSPAPDTLRQVRQVREAPGVAALIKAAGKVSGALNDAFHAGTEEREGGSARRQGKLMDQYKAVRAEIKAALALLTKEGV